TLCAPRGYGCSCAISREAARRRRRVESDVFGDLSRLLPLQPSVRAHLDKPSVIRLTLSYIRMQGLNPLDETSMYLKILEGFLMVLSTMGDMIFLSDNVSKYMGLSQVSLQVRGLLVLSYTHPCDHEEIRHNLQLGCSQKRDFVLRIKSALTHRGRVGNLKSTTWKVLHCQGRVKLCTASSSVSCLLLTCRPLPLSHTLLSTHTFTSQHSMDMRFTYCDQRLTSLLGYRPEELLGRSIYDLCHTLDTSCLNKNHLNLCLKSQSVSGQYRMLVRSGGYVWVESHSAVIPGVQPSRSRPNPSQPLCILSVTYILSKQEDTFCSTLNMHVILLSRPLFYHSHHPSPVFMLTPSLSVTPLRLGGSCPAVGQSEDGVHPLT
uniref:Endothelial PAS domain protein 1b n=1 Tax=Poecilia mexicana TaxID=48701 RepID=A0A3B3WZD1_9TELE